MRTIFRKKHLNKGRDTIKVVPPIVFSYLLDTAQIYDLERNAPYCYSAISDSDDRTIYTTYCDKYIEVYRMYRGYDWNIDIDWSTKYNSDIVDYYRDVITQLDISSSAELESFAWKHLDLHIQAMATIDDVARFITDMLEKERDNED